MRPFLDKEYQAFFLKREVPFDAFRAIEALANIQNLASTSTPINMPVNLFRMLLGTTIHADERGNAMLLDADIVKPEDAQLTADELKAIRAELELNNAGKLASGELQKEYSELYALTGG